MSRKWLIAALLVSFTLGLAACSPKKTQEQPVEEETVLAIPENLDGTYQGSSEKETYHLTLKNGTGTLIADDGEGNKIVRKVQILDSEGMMVDEEYMTYSIQDHKLHVEDVEYDDEGLLEPEKIFTRTG